MNHRLNKISVNGLGHWVLLELKHVKVAVAQNKMMNL